MANNNKVLYALICGHAAPASATKISGALKCAWCQTNKTIIGVIEYEWCATCQNCPFSRYAGLSKINAGIFLTGHLRRNPSHKGFTEYKKNPTAVNVTFKFRQWQVGQPAVGRKS